MKQETMGQEPLLKEKDAALWLSLAVQTLRQWRSYGNGPPYCKINGAVRYRPADMRQYIAGTLRLNTSEAANQNESHTS